MQVKLSPLSKRPTQSVERAHRERLVSLKWQVPDWISQKSWSKAPYNSRGLDKEGDNRVFCQIFSQGVLTS